MVYEPHAKNADLLWACGLCAGFTGIDNYIQKENKGLSADSALPCAVDDRPLLSCCRTGTVRYGVLRSKECVSPWNAFMRKKQISFCLSQYISISHVPRYH